MADEVVVGYISPPESSRWDEDGYWKPVKAVIAERDATIESLTDALESDLDDKSSTPPPPVDPANMDAADRALAKVSDEERKTILTWITSSNGLLLALMFLGGMVAGGWLQANRDFNIYSTITGDDGGATETEVVEVPVGDGSTTTLGDPATTTVTVAPTTTAPTVAAETTTTTAGSFLPTTQP